MIERIESGAILCAGSGGRTPGIRRGGAKGRKLKRHKWLAGVRVVYERLLNEALERAGRPERVTCESHRTRMARAEDQGDHEVVDHLQVDDRDVDIGQDHELPSV